MRKQLKPIAGALIVGLIGVAQACFYETSYVCAEGGVQLDPGLYGIVTCGQFSAVTPTSNWYGYEVHETTSTEGTYNYYSSGYYCQGTVSYHNYCTGQDSTTGPFAINVTYSRTDPTPCTGR